LALEAGMASCLAWSKKHRATLAYGLLGLLFVVGAVYEAHTYFVRQAADPGVWAEFSASEYMMGSDLEALAPNTHGLVRADWADSYTFRFMTYPHRDFEHFDPSRHVPFQDTAVPGKNYFYILDESYLPLLPLLKGFYPHGEEKEYHHPMTGELLYWTYFVPADEIGGAARITQGLTGRYYVSSGDGKAQHGPEFLRIKRRDPFILFNWTVDPVPGFFSVEWSGHLKAEKSGLYHFFTFSNDQNEVEVDGQKLFSRPHLPEGNLWNEGSLKLSPGRHSIRIRYAEARSYSRMELWWQPPGGDKEVVPTRVLYPE
jgi:hypothetical protein